MSENIITVKYKVNVAAYCNWYNLFNLEIEEDEVETDILALKDVSGVIESIKGHFQYLNNDGHLLKKINDRYRRQVRTIIKNRYEKHIWKDNKKSNQLEDEILKQVKQRLSPIDLAVTILKDEGY